MTPTSIVAYLVLFALVAGLFLLVSLTLGRFLRANVPSQRKGDPYECGEPAIGSSFVQFNLRFYVVALVFLIFDVEVAFFFPWATVFGKATQLMDPHLPKVESTHAGPSLTPAVQAKLRELGVRRPQPPLPAGTLKENALRIEADARLLAGTAMVDLAVFFLVLMVGFAYVWARGDLSWIWALERPVASRGAPAAIPSTPLTPLTSNAD